MLSLHSNGVGVQKPAYAVLTNIPIEWKDPLTNKKSIIYVSAPLHFGYDCTLIDILLGETPEHKEWQLNHLPLKKKKFIAIEILKQLVKLIKVGKGHGDIKLDNILILNITSDQPEVAIGDWADSWFPNKEPMATVAGLCVKTREHIGPEEIDEIKKIATKILLRKRDNNSVSELKELDPVIQAHYSRRDILASGVALFAILSGHFPYKIKDDRSEYIPIDTDYPTEWIQKKINEIDPEVYAEESTQYLLWLIQTMCSVKASARAKVDEIEAFLNKYFNNNTDIKDNTDITDITDNNDLNDNDFRRNGLSIVP